MVAIPSPLPWKLAFVTIAPCPMAGAQKQAAEVDSSQTEGLELYLSAGRRSSLRIDSRVYVDAATYENSEVLIDGDSDLSLSGETEPREARIGIKGIFDENWLFELVIDVFDAELDLEDEFLGYAPRDHTSFRIDQDKEPFSLQPMTSSRHQVFMDLAFRYSDIDLNDFDAGMFEGASIQRTLGLNWDASRDERLMLNNSWAINDRFADTDGDAAGNGNFSLLQFRSQITL